MDAATILERISSDGLTLAREPAGKLRLQGPAAARARWLPLVREHKVELVELLSEPLPVDPALPPDVVATINAWLDTIGEHHPEDRAELLSNCARDHEGLLGILGLAAEAGITAPAEPVTCATCRHFERDRTGDGSGLGRCGIDAPASRRPPALWPNAPHLCSDHEETVPMSRSYRPPHRPSAAQLAAERDFFAPTVPPTLETQPMPDTTPQLPPANAVSLAELDPEALEVARVFASLPTNRRQQILAALHLPLDEREEAIGGIESDPIQSAPSMEAPSHGTQT